MRVLDLFSGIGGFSLGLEAAGMETAAFCEREPFCQAVLRKHWPNTPIHSDITELDGYEYRGTVQLVCGGFPCQPFSVAGQQRGAEDDRALWPQMLRVICEVQPTWVIGENVTGIINMELDTVLSDLEREGYSCQTFVIPACAVDAQHRRDRVWVVAHADREGEPDGTQHGQRMVAHTNGAYQQRRGLSSGVHAKDHDANSDSTFSKSRNVADAECERQQRSRESFNTLNSKTQRKRQATQPFYGGEPAIWEPEPSVGRVADGVPNRTHRLKSLGNAVVPQVVEQIGKAIMAMR